MTDLTTMTDQQLEDRKADLTRQFLAAATAERAPIDADIRAIEQEQRRRALVIGQESRAAVDTAAGGLREVQDAEPLDAVSGVRRQARRARNRDGGG